MKDNILEDYKDIGIDYYREAYTTTELEKKYNRDTEYIRKALYMYRRNYQKENKDNFNSIIDTLYSSIAYRYFKYLDIDIKDREDTLKFLKRKCCMNKEDIKYLYENTKVVKQCGTHFVFKNKSIYDSKFYYIKFYSRNYKVLEYIYTHI